MSTEASIDQSEYIRMQSRLAELEELFGLREKFKQPSAVYFTNKETKVIGLLIKNVFVSNEFAWRALYGGLPDADQPHAKVFQVYICKIRKKLKPFGIEIKNRWGEGYFLVSDDRRKLSMLMEKTA